MRHNLSDELPTILTFIATFCSVNIFTEHRLMGLHSVARIAVVDTVLCAVCTLAFVLGLIHLEQKSKESEVGTHPR